MKKSSLHRYFEILSLMPGIQFNDVETERRFCELAAAEIRNSISQRKKNEVFLAAVENRPVRQFGRPRSIKPAPADNSSAPETLDSTQQPET